MGHGAGGTEWGAVVLHPCAGGSLGHTRLSCSQGLFQPFCIIKTPGTLVVEHLKSSC